MRGQSGPHDHGGVTLSNVRTPPVMFKLARVSAALFLMGWAYVRFEDYACMLPWNQDARAEYHATWFVLTSAVFFVGFVWLCAEVSAPAFAAMKLRPLAAWFGGILTGLLLYGSVALFTYASYPRWGWDADEQRIPLSLSWVAGALERAGRYGAHCGE
jgi:hypothetical protein